MPKLPPTLPVSTRNFSGGTFSMSFAICARSPKTPWLPTWSVQRSEALSYSPMALRGSMAQTTTRLLRIDMRVTCAARAKASSTLAASP